MARPSPEQLVEFWNLRTMPTENVRFWQSYVDDEIGPDGKPLCSAIVALLVDDLPSSRTCTACLPTRSGTSTSATRLSCCFFTPTVAMSWSSWGKTSSPASACRPSSRRGLYGGAVTAWWRVRRLRQHDGAGVRSHRLRGRDRGGADYGLAATGRSDSRIDAR
jgi:hypothetical protein